MERVGVCISCHKDIPDRKIPISMLVRAGKTMGLSPVTDDEHAELLNQDIKWAACSKILTPVFAMFLIIAVLYCVRRIRR